MTLPGYASNDGLWFDRLTPDGDRERIRRPVADETPVAIEFNGIGYAVLMASGADIADLAVGFACSERVISERRDIIGLDIHPTPEGLVVRLTLEQDRIEHVVERVRHRVSESSCGLCGIENLEQAMRPLPPLKARSRADGAALFRALAGLDGLQPRNRQTGAMHAAALCSAQGEVLLVREDVGRHNAFDKLIGAMLSAGRTWAEGFALLSSRCSYELVEKAVLSGCPLLATISAPTNLAVRRAKEAGLDLIVLARPDALLSVPADRPGGAA